MSKNIYMNKYNKKLRSVKTFTDGDGWIMPNTPDKGGDRKALFRKQRKKYGFDERETWSMDYTSMVWLYEHIRMYMDIGGKVVDLDAPLADELKDELIKEDVHLDTMNEVLEYICELIEEWDRKYQDDEADFAPARRALRIYAVMLPAMWW